MNQNKVKIIAEPNKQEYFVHREFNAHRELVFKAYTDPNLLIQWIGTEGSTVTFDKFEGYNGGSFRYTITHLKGDKETFRGVHHEILLPARIVQTFEYEGMPGHVLLETIRFEEINDNRTLLTSQSVFQSIYDRDIMLQTGFEQGTKDSYSKLDKILEKLS